MEPLVPCTELNELEASYGALTERRRVAVTPIQDRRKLPKSWFQARAAYIIHLHRRNCVVCRIDLSS
jgi:hypothetical protein